MPTELPSPDSPKLLRRCQTLRVQNLLVVENQRIEVIVFVGQSLGDVLGHDGQSSLTSSGH